MMKKAEKNEEIEREIPFLISFSLLSFLIKLLIPKE